ncbi:hypothetical protein [Reichenbachiella sp. 5M10]|uniref:hypothetical protein n=1 Tax=Reichenbachiella sp. 5M10 TaxID=1889772 RepID=UPI00117BBE16|nr:hypothetical protein [Reichenbachiella sp. 5M10]
MKNSIKSIALSLLAVVLISTSSYAGGAKEKAVEKANDVIEHAAPDDWMLLAKQAQFLLRKEAGLSTAKSWLDQSLKIKEDSYNLSILGDYYLKCNLNDQAVNAYVQSMEVLKKDDATVDTEHIQVKIVEAMGW